MTYQKATNIPTHKILTNRLSVQLSLTGLSFLVTDSSSNEEVFFYEKPFHNLTSPEELLIEINKIFSDYESLSEEFKEVVLIYTTNLYALVPTPLFNEKIASEYLKLNSKILVNDFVAFDVLDSNNITVVYIPFVNINNYFFEKFGNFKYYHSSTLLLKHILGLEKYSKKPKIYINMEKSIFDIIITNEGNLEFGNSFEYKSPEDFIYYVLFTLEQLKLNPDSIECILTGNIKKEDDYYTILYTYIRHIQLYSINQLISISGKDPHQNLSLKITA